MKIKLHFIVLLVVFSIQYAIVAQEFQYRTVENNAFITGEKLKFSVYYDAMFTGKVNAGSATIEVKNSGRKFKDREVYQIIGVGKSTRTFDLFFPVRDRFESFVDKQALVPHLFVRRTREGSYVKDDDVTFLHEEGVAISRKKTKPIEPFIQDIMSALFYARTIDFADAQKGQNFSVNFFLDDSAYMSVIQFQGREVVETSLGVFNCLVFMPMVATGEVFGNQYPMTLWVTDDKNKLPVLAKSAVVVGAVKMELIKYSGLANPVTAKIKK